MFGQDYWESYSPVCQGSSVRLLLVMSIIHGLHTCQIDYQNAFCQAELGSKIFVEIQKGYTDFNDEPCCLRLNKSLYRMVDARLNFFRLLSTNLKNCGFEQMTQIDPCLFVHKKMLCVTYVDNASG